MLQSIANLIIRLTGWRIVGEVPQIPQAVFIAAPHTSNWDGFWLLVCKTALDIDVRFLAKHSLFWWPLGPVLSAMGAIPIDRGKHLSTVAQLVDTFGHEEKLFLALAPEGTRKWQPHWKTGFYRIAKEAGVPIVLTFIDYRNREMGIGSTIHPHERDHDMVLIREFYRPFTPRHPQLQGPIEFPPD